MKFNNKTYFLKKINGYWSMVEEPQKMGYVQASNENGNIIKMHSLTNGIYDEVDEDVLYKKTNEVILQSSDIFAYLTSLTNVDVIIYKLDALACDIVKQNASINNSTRINGRNEITLADRDNTSNKGNYYTTSIDLGIIVAKGSFTDTTDAQANFSATSLIYQLEEEKTYKLNINPLTTCSSTAITFEKVVHEVSYYDSMNGCRVTYSEYPILSIDFIKKINEADESYIELDSSLAVISEDNLSFTHPELTDKDLVHWDYYYNEKLGTSPAWEITVANNHKEQINSNAKGIEQLSKITQDIDERAKELQSQMIDLSSKTEKIIGVKEYGTKGDGITDDTDAIQKLLNTLESGQSIYFPKGTYLVRGLTIQNVEKFRMFGDGWGSQLKLIDGSDSNVLNIINSPRFILENISVNGNGDNQTNVHGGVYVERSEFSVISKAEICSCKSYGLRFTGITNEIWEGTDEINIHNCYIHQNSGSGLEINDTHDHNVSACNIEFNKGHGIHLTACSCLNIFGSTIVSNDKIGIHAQDSVRLNINANQVRYNGENGIKCIGGKQYNITNNVFHINGRVDTGFQSGILIAYTTKAFVIGNQSIDIDFDPKRQTYGLETYSVSELVIIGNDFVPNLVSPVMIDADTSYIAYGNNGLGDKNGITDKISELESRLNTLEQNNK